MNPPELPSLAEIEAAARLIAPAMPPTPQYAWPLLRQALGAEVWVKHENHTPLGAFKVRGGLVYLAALAAGEPPGAARGKVAEGVTEVVAATRGNHGQSVAFAAARHGLRATIVVPHGNSREKNAAMRALGAELLEHGEDFQAAREHAQALAAARGAHLLPSFHPLLVRGVATAGLEFLRGAPPLDAVFVPIGLGSGLCGMAAARAALGLRGTRLVGVVSAHARAYALSLAAGRPVDAPATTRLADGMACRSPDPQALALMQRHMDDIVEVDDAEVAAAMRLLHEACHSTAEGAGAAALAAAMQTRDRWQGRRVGVVLSGGNIDRALLAEVLAGG